MVQYTYDNNYERQVEDDYNRLALNRANHSWDNSKNKTCSRGLQNTVLQGVAFNLIFMAFNTLQNFLTTILEDPNDKADTACLGFESLLILYGSVVLSLPFTPSVIRCLGTKWTQVLGGACFVFYMASLITGSKYFILVASSVIGFGAAILWTAQGAYLTAISDANARGFYSGVFWGVFQLSGITGNLCAYFLFKSGTGALYIGATLVAGLGTLLLCFLATPPSTKVDEYDNLLNALSVKDQKTSLCNCNLMLLCPLLFLTGFELAWATGEFPYIFAPFKNQSGSIPLAFTAFGVAETFGAIGMGKLSDIIGRKLTVILGGLCYCGAIALALVLKEEHSVVDPIDTISVYAYLACFLIGISDCIINVQVYATLGELYSEDSVGAFTMFQMLQNVGSVIMYLSPLTLTMIINGTAFGQGGCDGASQPPLVKVVSTVAVGVTVVVSALCYLCVHNDSEAAYQKKPKTSTTFESEPSAYGYYNQNARLGRGANENW